MKQIAILMLAGIALAAQIPENQLTFTLKNGRWWAGLSSTGKTYYLIGMADGLGSADLYANAVAAIGPHPPAKPYDTLSLLFAASTFAEIEIGVDRFYGEPANAAVPIVAALRLFREKVEGSTPEEQSAHAAEARRLALPKAAPAK
jgi:hypothetical protein